MLSFMLPISAIQALILVAVSSDNSPIFSATIAGVFLLVNTVLTIHLTRSRNGNRSTGSKEIEVVEPKKHRTGRRKSNGNGSSEESDQKTANGSQTRSKKSSGGSQR